LASKIAGAVFVVGLGKFLAYRMSTKKWLIDLAEGNPS